jgi:hypothetical protein
MTCAVLRSSFCVARRLKKHPSPRSLLLSRCPLSRRHIHRFISPNPKKVLTPANSERLSGNYGQHDADICFENHRRRCDPKVSIIILKQIASAFTRCVKLKDLEDLIVLVILSPHLLLGFWKSCRSVSLLSNARGGRPVIILFHSNLCVFILSLEPALDMPARGALMHPGVWS